MIQSAYRRRRVYKYADTRLIFAHYIMYLAFVKAFFSKNGKKAVKVIVTCFSP